MRSAERQRGYDEGFKAGLLHALRVREEVLHSLRGRGEPVRVRTSDALFYNR